MDRVYYFGLLLVFCAWMIQAQTPCEPFDPDYYMCCNGVVNPKPANSECCGTKAYNRDELRCCDGLLSKNYPGDGACCGYIAYERSTQQCCDNTITPRKSDNVSCCMHVGIDRYTEICCNDNVQPRPENGACCGPYSYDAGLFRCCNKGLIWPQSEGCPNPVDEEEENTVVKRDVRRQARLSRISQYLDEVLDD